MGEGGLKPDISLRMEATHTHKHKHTLTRKRSAAQPSKPLSSKWAGVAPARALTREEWLAEDAAFLARIGTSPKARQDAVKLVRRGR